MSFLGAEITGQLKQHSEGWFPRAVSGVEMTARQRVHGNRYASFIFSSLVRESLPKKETQ